MNKIKTYEVRVRVMAKGSVLVGASSEEEARRLATAILDERAEKLERGSGLVMESEPAEVVSVREVD